MMREKSELKIKYGTQMKDVKSMTEIATTVERKGMGKRTRRETDGMKQKHWARELDKARKNERKKNENEN